MNVFDNILSRMKGHSFLFTCVQNWRTRGHLLVSQTRHPADSNHYIRNVFTGMLGTGKIWTH